MAWVVQYCHQAELVRDTRLHFGVPGWGGAVRKELWVKPGQEPVPEG